MNIIKSPNNPFHTPQMLVIKTREVMALEWHYIELDEFDLRDSKGVVHRFKRSEVEDFEG